MIDLRDDLRRTATGDRQAFARIYDATVVPAYRLACCAVGDRSIAEKVVREAFGEVWRSAGRYHRCSLSVQAWVVTIVYQHAKCVAGSNAGANSGPSTLST